MYTLPLEPSSNILNTRSSCLCLCCRSGNLSTNAEVLGELLCQHPLPGIILQHRKLSKLLDGFLNTLLAKVQQAAAADPLHSDSAAGAGAGSAVLAAGGGPGSALLTVAAEADSRSSRASAVSQQRLVRIRGTFLQTNTSTGRLAMDDPSLQTIPRPVEYQLALSPASQAAAAAGDDVTAGSPVAVMQQQLSNIRAAFVAPCGSVLVSADYCQIELRLMAHFSGDAALLAALTQPGGDPFIEMAASWLKLDKAQVGAERGGMQKAVLMHWRLDRHRGCAVLCVCEGT